MRVDIALWDLAGKHFGVPCHRLARALHHPRLGHRHRRRRRTAGADDDRANAPGAGAARTAAGAGPHLQPAARRLNLTPPAVGPGMVFTIPTAPGIGFEIERYRVSA